MSSATQHIWNPETGIIDIEVPWQDLAASEMPGIRLMWEEQRERLAGTQRLTTFTDRLRRQWAIETGILENLYDIERGVTMTLIERGFHAEFLTHGSTNKPTPYVINLLRDQEEAFEGVMDFVAKSRQLSTSYIKELHAALLRSQHTTEATDTTGKEISVPLIRGDWKIQPNYPTRAGVLYAYCPPEHVASEMQRLIEMHTQHLEQGVAPEVEAAWLHHRFSQIHPFQDGNGRVCRAIASLVLVQAGLFPLIVTRDEKNDYLDALEAADKGNLSKLVALFAKLQRQQFLKAAVVSESVISAANDMDSLLQGLEKATPKAQTLAKPNIEKVFDHAHALEQQTSDALDALIPNLRQYLAKAGIDANIYSCRSTEKDSHWYYGQIKENARNNYHYFINDKVYRSWVSLRVYWQRRARLVFAFHAASREFTGTMICAPFIEFLDPAGENETRATLIPISDEAFLFFHNEIPDQLKKRFKDWLNPCLLIAIKQLADGT